jgi:beta-lactam-binding protein with PASTA domain
VISTDPSAGAKVTKGSRLDAVVSKGPERFAMPTVVGLSQAAATEALTKANLGLGKLLQGYSDTVPPGLVLKASKTPGTSLKRGTAIDLTVCAGPKPIKIKDYTGKDAADAIKALTKAGFAVTEATAVSETVAKGKVVSQNPDAGAGIKGDPITVTRSLGPPLVTVPNVSSMGVRAAQKVMADAGFKTKVKAVAVNYIGVGYVVYSKPHFRAQAPKGSTITLYVV